MKNKNTGLKNLLVLGGAYQHRKIVEAAHRMGIRVVVTDYLDRSISPAKQIADADFMVNVTDVDGLVKLCIEESIDGVIAPYLDITQRPYQELCEKMNYPCFGNQEQNQILTDKALFKEFCIAHDADVITSYTEEDILEDRHVQYPILIKPTDSRGSRGISVCSGKEDAIIGINLAKAESSTGNIIIEQYLENCDDLQLAYIVVDGEPRLLKVEDRYLGEKGKGFDKLCIATIAPSYLRDRYIQIADEKVKHVIRKMGLKNAPVFIQAFFDGTVVRLYDPGLRLPGDDYDVALRAATGIDVAEWMVHFALTGSFPQSTNLLLKEIEKDNHLIAMILPCLKAGGTITQILGLDDVIHIPEVVSYSCAYRVGNTVEKTNNVKQRFGEFVICCEDADHLKCTIDRLFESLSVLDEHGYEMLIEKFDTSLINNYYTVR